MRFRDYVKDRLLFFIINGLLFAVLGCMLYLFQVGSGLILVVGCLWFVPLFSYVMVEYLRSSNFYDELKSVLENLDKAYLLPEIIKEPTFIEGKLLHGILKKTSKAMHEQVNKHRDRQQDYREFIEIWVHEVKTPIASAKLIIGNNESTATKAIDYELKHIEDYVDQVLYYARSQNVNKDFVIKQVSLTMIITNLIKRNARDFINKRIAVDIDDVEGTVYSDAKWLEFILQQIISNAIKYCKAGEGKVTIHSICDAKKMTLIIEDNGIGIVDSDLSRVWEKGFTGENGRLYIRSTGIGLYLCKNLCQKLGLGISLTSQVGVGTQVSILFPIDEII
ncbi:sensor histidine kinase [Paenibacillus qinlingensis]|uniref:histidine kinase n=1 Tax=Paenibacillus qinlingensis TaxID=1837343 RepID=A0ABU1NRP1_9BACL|nr:sensor histidine kinase [Paenibacillus qinlingensis]MDR6550155.1 signal transduction histidine kinase [Paenibacillus qinlingensis]